MYMYLVIMLAKHLLSRPSMFFLHTYLPGACDPSRPEKQIEGLSEAQEPSASVIPGRKSR
jgi:hypothetical protein